MINSAARFSFFHLKRSSLLAMTNSAARFLFLHFGKFLFAISNLDASFLFFELLNNFIL
jgi:hypothetical protein